jgi:glycosidase
VAVGSFATAAASTNDNSVSASVDSGSVEANYGLASKIEDGNILHCFDWTYNDIKAELKNIAEAGFTAVQTSPVQTPDPLGQWYGLYLPREFNCTTSPLGSKSELQALCAEADNYGIKVICDVVANHLTGDHANIQNDLKDRQYWHDEFDVSDWNNRYQVTNGKIGMADLNTNHSYVQQVVYNYLESLKAIGVDGFRFDAAKHIGLPSEGDGFWKKIAQTGVYRYGEILDNPGGDAESVMKEYADYIGITDIPENWNLRALSEFANTNLNAKGEFIIRDDELDNITKEEMKERLLAIAEKRYTEQEQIFGEGMREIERIILLRVVDTLWMDHLDEMEHVKREIGLRAYGQHDPVVEYRNVGSDLYEGMLESIKRDTVRYILTVQPKPEVWTV